LKIRYSVILLLISFLFLTGCTTKEELTCEFENTSITITLEYGKIVKYVDKLTGEASEDAIEIMNKDYLKDITDNKEAIKKLKEVIATTGGDCTKQQTN